MKRPNTGKWFYGFRRKLFLGALGLALLIIIPIAVGICVIVGKSTRENLVGQYQIMTEKYSLAFDKIYRELDTVTGNFVTDELAQKSLKGTGLSEYEAQRLVRQLSFINSPYSNYFLFWDNKGNAYSQKKIKAGKATIERSRLQRGLGEEYAKTKLLWEQDVLFGTGEKALFAGRYVRPMDKDGEPGSVFLKCKPDLYQEITEGVKDHKAVYLLMDGQGQICFEKKPEGFSWKEGEKQRIANAVMEEGISGLKNQALPAVGGYLCIERHKETGFYLTAYIPKSVFNEVLKKILWVIAVIFAAVMAAAFFLIVYGTKRMTRPVIYLSKRMENFDGTDFEEIVKMNTNTELDCIGQSYNSMLGRIHSLIEEVRYQETELGKVKLTTLLYQIHPHFLYNTLDTVYMLARITREETIMKMVHSLSRYLRIILSDGADEIPIEKELEHVKAYLDIQKIRSDKLFDFEISCDTALAKIKVIKMILQPLAENSIKHGFSEMAEGGRIRIAIREEGEFISFSVENNGALMAPKTAERMNRLECMELEEIGKQGLEEGGYGIGNVVKRLRLRYNDRIRFYYEVSLTGTICMIKIEKSAIWQEDKGEAAENETHGEG